VIVLYSAACLPLRFSQPEGIARERKPHTQFLRRHLFRLGMADRVTIVPPRDSWPFSTVTTDDLEALVAEGLLALSPVTRSRSGWPLRAEPPRPRRRGMS
jgi:hypothetical protein